MMLIAIVTLCVCVLIEKQLFHVTVQDESVNLVNSFKGLETGKGRTAGFKCHIDGFQLQKQARLLVYISRIKNP